MRVIVAIFAVIVFFCNAENIKAYGSNPVLTNMIYLLNPQSLIGFNYKPYQEDLEFMDKKIHNLPILGGFMNGAQTNIETLIKLKPQVIFTSGSGIIGDFEKQLQKLNIRTINLKVSNLNEMLDSLLIMGEELNRKQKAQDLKKWIENNIKVLKEIPQNRPLIYFAQGVDGLQSFCVDRGKSDLAKIIGGENIIKCDNNKNSRININPEQLLKAQPDIIFVREVAMFRELKENPKGFWTSLNAVKNKKIFYAPSSPSNWLHRPPSLMQGLGLRWAFDVVKNADFFAKEEIPLDEYNKNAIKEFYSLFLGIKLDDNDLKKLFKIK